jgi:hypothetical protein
VTGIPAQTDWPALTPPIDWAKPSTAAKHNINRRIYLVFIAGSVEDEYTAFGD